MPRGQALNSRRPEQARKQYEQRSIGMVSHTSFPDKPYPHSMLMVFKQYEYSRFEAGLNSAVLTNGVVDQNGRSSADGTLRGKTSIELPFPKQLVDNTTLNINGVGRDPLMERAAQTVNEFLNQGGTGTLGDIPQAIQQMGASAANLLGGAGATSAGGLKSAAESLARSLGATSNQDAATMGQYLLKVLGRGVVGKSLDLVTGQTLNPKETLAFEGVQLRQHQFTWDLYPSNMADTDRIREIVKKLKQMALPTTGDLGSLQKIFLNYPHIVDIYLLGVNNEFFPTFKPAMITSVSVDYGPGGGVGIMKGGVPAGVNLSVSLMELEIQTAEDMEVRTDINSSASLDPMVGMSDIADPYGASNVG